jgi:hypothetical protein
MKELMHLPRKVPTPLKEFVKFFPALQFHYPQYLYIHHLNPTNPLSMSSPLLYSYHQSSFHPPTT